MIGRPKYLFGSMFLAVLIPLLHGSKEDPGFTGMWELEPEKSTDMDPWRGLKLEIREKGSSVTFIRSWTAGRYSHRDSMTLQIGGIKNEIPLRPGKWIDNVYLGVFVTPNSKKAVVANWEDDGQSLHLETNLKLETSQGEAPLSIHSYYRLSADASALILTETRSTRQTGPPLVYVFSRLKPQSPEGHE